MSAETTTSTSERTHLNLLRLFFSSAASAIVFVIGTLIAEQYKAGTLTKMQLYLIIVLGFGLIFTIVTFTAGVKVLERIPTKSEKFSLKHVFEPFQVHSFRILLGMYVCAGLMMNVEAALVIAFATYVIKISTPVFMGIIIVVQLAVVAGINKWFTSTSKNVIYGRLIPLAVIAMAAICLWPSNWPVWPIYVWCALLAVGAAGTQMMTWVMFGDVMDAAELQLGHRHAGAMSSAMTFAKALGASAFMMAIGWVLQINGYRGTVDSGSSGSVQSALAQPDTAVWAIRLLLLIGVAGPLILGWLLAKRYPLTHDVVLKNASELSQRR